MAFTKTTTHADDLVKLPTVVRLLVDLDEYNYLREIPFTWAKVTSTRIGFRVDGADNTFWVSKSDLAPVTADQTEVVWDLTQKVLTKGQHAIARRFGLQIRRPR